MVELNHKYGCLTVLDLGDEYSQTELYTESKEKLDLLKKEINILIGKRQELISNNPSMFEMERRHIVNSKNAEFHRELMSCSEKINRLKHKIDEYEAKASTHYKCQCKCGRIYYYNAFTLESKPRYCFYPVPIATKYTYSSSAQDARKRKKEKYANLEHVLLCDKSECLPSDKYCKYYNEYKTKQIYKKEEKFRLETEKLPRVYAQNYDVDYTGMQYESLFVEKCYNDHLESEPTFSFSQFHKKHWHNITVYKQYKCRCTICGKEHFVTCDKFGIYPPTEFGIRAYNGYWSEVYCDCHKISSFQWKVNKLLIDNSIPYQVEYSFPDLYGIGKVNLLRYDFAILNSDKTVKCLIECQGEQHYKPLDEFGGNVQYETQIKNDQLKREYAQKHSIPMIEISYRDKKYEAIEKILKENNII